jgi:hypothetical protein
MRRFGKEATLLERRKSAMQLNFVGLIHASLPPEAALKSA